MNVVIFIYNFVLSNMFMSELKLFFNLGFINKIGWEVKFDFILLFLVFVFLFFI